MAKNKYKVTYIDSSDTRSPQMTGIFRFESIEDLQTDFEYDGFKIIKIEKIADKE